MSTMTSGRGLSHSRMSRAARLIVAGVSRTVMMFRFLSARTLTALNWGLSICCSIWRISSARMFDRRKVRMAVSSYWRRFMGTSGTTMSVRSSMIL